MNKEHENYEKLKEISRHTHLLSGVSQLLDWDQETYMPPAGGPMRSEQLKVLSGIIHKEQVGKKFSNALGKLIDIKSGTILAKSLSAEQQAALDVWRQDYIKKKALPSKFVEDFTKLTSQSVQVWRMAKKNNQFLHFAPYLDKIVLMLRKKADLIGYKDHPYDALVDDYERGVTTQDIEKVFTPLRTSIVALLKKLMEKKPADDSFLHGNFPLDKQMAFGRQILDAMGHTSDRGRLDLSAHPFSSSSHPNDSRLTTRIHETNVYSSISAVLHEGGHGLYCMGLPVEQYGSPLGEAVSMGIHESQSRWWETRIGNSRHFWKYWLPTLKQLFPEKLEPISLDQFYQGINKVSPSLIRVESDEVTYSLHVILRFEIEKALIEGSLKVRDLPGVWNNKMKELLGITPPDNTTGCLQDIHWSFGGIGYFPTYTLGNLYAAHLFAQFETDHADWGTRVETGELLFINDWLREKVWKHGRRYSSKELLKVATGKEFTSDAYITYLNKKYLK